MIDWIMQHGGEVNVVVAATPQAGRSTWAATAFAKGDVLARIPLHLCYTAGSDSSNELHTVAAQFWRHVSNATSPHQPYFAALPRASEVWSLHNFPLAYLSLIQSHPVESSILRTQQLVQEYWEQYRQAVQPGSTALGEAISLADLKYAMALLLTRLFQFPEEGLLLIPLLDMANHRNGCPHLHKKEPCRTTGGLSESASQDQCVVWRAGEDIAAGEEVCNSYKYMLNDRSLLQYGFLQAGPAARQLSGIDRHDFNPDHPWQDLPAGLHGPLRFEGPPAAVAVELHRLHRLKHSLQHKDQLLQQQRITADPQDTNGAYLLSTLLKWRQQRQAAVELEIDRLSRQLERLRETDKQLQMLTYAGSGRAQQQQQQEILGELMAALQSSGAQLNVTMNFDGSSDMQGTPGACPLDGSTTSNQSSSTTATCPAAHERRYNGSTTGTCTAADLRQYSSSTVQSALTAALPSGLYATTRVQAGDQLAVLPLRGALKLNTTSNEGVLDLGVKLMLGMHRTRAKGATAAHVAASNPNDAVWQAYYAALPALGAVHGLYSFPLQYLPLIQNEAAETHIKAVHALTLSAWDRHRPAVEAVDDSLTIQEYKHALNWINARLLAYEQGTYLVPLLSLANPHLSNGCLHQDYVDTCASSTAAATTTMVAESVDTGKAGAARSFSPRQADDTSLALGHHIDPGCADSTEPELCLYWVAGQDVAPGEELCVSWGFLLSDVALLQFGVLLRDAAGDARKLELLSMDRHDFNAQELFAGLASAHEPPPPFAGTPEEAVLEVARLTVLYGNLTSAAARAAAAAVQISAYDAGGRLLAQLHILRQQRIAAIEAEIDRIMGVYGISTDMATEAVQWYQQQQQQWHDVPATASEVDDAGEDDPWQNMLRWMKAHGAVVELDIRYVSPEAGRAVFTTHALKKGDIMAAIPLDLAFSTAKHGGNASTQLAAANMFVMMSDPSSPLQPYFQTLPTKEEVIAPLVHTPQEYFPVLQSDLLVKSIQAYQQSNQQFWDAYQDDLQAALSGMAMDDFKYARSLISTRFFGGGPEYGNLMLPLIDMANHRQDCPHHHVMSSCPANPQLQCLLWIAGSYLQAGEEVCNFYQFMLNDRSMLQYGFLQDDMLALHTIDRPGVHANSSDVWSMWGADKLGPPPFNGTLAETEAEVTRLTNLAAELERGDAAAAAVTAVAGDANGSLLKLLLRWRQLRQEAVQRQIQLLRQRADQLKSGVVETAEARFVQWLKSNNAYVHPNLGVRPAANSNGRALFATGPIKAAEPLAVIPLKLAVPISQEYLLDDVPRLMQDMSHPGSPRQPYWAVLPANGTVLSQYSLSLEYLPLVQHAASEQALTDMRSVLEEYAAERADVLAHANMTLGDMLHVLSLVATRGFHFDAYGMFMIPLADFAQRSSSCTSMLAVGQCKTGEAAASSSSSSSGNSGHSEAPPSLCIFWHAGSELAAGDAACTQYSYVLPDRALLQLGSLNGDGRQLAELNGIDRHDFPSDMAAWQFRVDATDAPPQFAGSPAETAAELSRLQELAAALRETDAAAAMIGPADADASGLMLDMLLQWRQQRTAAVKQEIARLQASLQLAQQ